MPFHSPTAAAAVDRAGGGPRPVARYQPYLPPSADVDRAAGAEPGELVGREPELSALAERLTGAAAGSSSFVVVEGSPGIGKSALLSVVAAAAERSGLRVLRAGGSTAECDIAFGVVSQLFALALDDSSDENRRTWLRGAAATADQILNIDGCPPDGPAAAPDLRAALHALYWLTVNAARQGPLLLVIDDAQWADPASLRWLIHLSRRMERLPLIVLVALSPDIPAPSTELAWNLLRNGTRMRLSGLDAGSFARLVEERLGVEPAAAFTAQCLAETDGVPLLLLDILQTVSPADAAAAANAARSLRRCGSRQLGETILMRLAQAGANLAELATDVALLGEASIETVAAVAGLPIATTVAATIMLGRMDVVTIGEQVALRHELTRRAVLSALPAGERGNLRVRAARALSERCAPTWEITAHLVRTATPVGEKWAVQTLWSAARTALAEGEPERAVPALRRLLAEPHERSTRARYLAELGAVEVYQEPTLAIEHLRAALPLLDRPAEVARGALRLAGALLDSPAAGEAVDVLADAIARVRAQDPGLADELCLQRLSLRTWLAADDPGLAADRQQLLDRMGGSVPPRLAPLLHAVDAVRLSLDARTRPQACALAVAALDGILAGADLGEDQAIAGAGNAAAALLRVGASQPLVAFGQRQAALADRRGQRQLAAWARALCAVAQYDSGEPVTAAAGARTVLQTRACARGGRHRLVRVLATAVLAGCHAERGQHQDGMALLAGEQLDGRLPGGWVYDHVLRARARIRFAGGEADAAVADLVEAGRRCEAGASNGPVSPWWRAAAAAGYAAQGDRDAAATLAQEQVGYARAAADRAALAEALLVLGVVANRQRCTAEAVGILVGPAATLAGDSLGQALDLVRQRGSGPLADQLAQLAKVLPRSAGTGQKRCVPAADEQPTAARPAGANGRRPAFGPASLTAHQRRLVALAMTGQTNDAIARSFGVSRRAVEFHFTQIYRKLGINRRPELLQFAAVWTA